MREGWKLVPVVPTADMIIAAGDGYETGEVIGPASCYRVMVAAAPAHPQQVKSEDARDAKALDRAEIMRLAKLSGFYVDQDNPTNEYGVTWYNGTVTTLQNFAAHVVAISAQD